MQLSASALNVFNDCKRCFYLDRKMKAPRPRGIFSSLPGGVDGILKARFDSMRGQLPKEMQTGELDGWRLFSDAVLLGKRRNWRSNDLVHKDHKGNTLVGALDDILENEAGDLMAPLDVKTKGTEPDQDYCERYYQRQLDIYALLLSKKHDVAAFGALLYFWPVECADNLIKFESKVFLLEVSAARAGSIFDEAIELLESDELPDASVKCEFCQCQSTRAEATMKALAGGR